MKISLVKKVISSRLVSALPRRLHAAIVVVVIAFVALAAAGCGESEPEWLYTRNRYMQIFALPPVLSDEVSFLAANTHRVIKSTNPNRTLALVRILLLNDRTAFMPLNIGVESAEIGDPRDDRIFAVDPYKQSTIVASSDPELERTELPLWGRIDLRKDTQVSGWLIFDVPKNLDLVMFWFNDPELASVPLQQD